MDIVFTCDNNFFQHFIVCICSICENNLNEDITFYLVSNSISDCNKKIALNLISRYQNKKIKFYKFFDSMLKSFPIGLEHQPHHILSLSCYYRLFLTKILPKSIKKVLYLDCDIIVRKNISPLFYTNIDGYALGAVKDSITESKEVYSRLEYESKYGYYNSGVLLINLDFLRLHNSLEKIFSYVSCNYEKIIFPDQDILNAVFHKDIKNLSYTYNYQTAFMEKGLNLAPSNIKEITKIEDNPCIVHFTTANKPWLKECTHPYKDIYKYYKNKTIFKNTKYHSILNKKQKIRNILSKLHLFNSPIITITFKKKFHRLKK